LCGSVLDAFDKIPAKPRFSSLCASGALATRSTFAEQYRAIADEIRLAAEFARRREFVVKAG